MTKQILKVMKQNKKMVTQQLKVEEMEMIQMIEQTL
jgi:hypothetical protein